MSSQNSFLMLAPWAGGETDGRKMRHLFFGVGLLENGVPSVKIVVEPVETAFWIRRHTSHEGRLSLVYTPGIKVTNKRFKRVGRVLNMIIYMVFAFFIGLTESIRKRPTLLVSTPHPGTTLVGLAIHMITRRPMLYEIRDPWPELLIQLNIIKDGALMARILKIIDLWAQSQAQKIICISPEDSHVDPKFRDKIIVARNGIPSDIIEGPKRTRVRNPGDPLKLIFAGGCANAFRMPLQLEALKLASTDLPAGSKFHVYTADAEAQMIGRELDKLELHDFVTVRGFLPYHEILAEIRDSDFYYFHLSDKPLFRKGINSNKLNDAIITGTPIILAANIKFPSVEPEDFGVHARPDDPQALADALVRAANATQEDYIMWSENQRAFAAAELGAASISQKLIV
nr:hypothetical protein [uncultured Shimia sp.]